MTRCIEDTSKRADTACHLLRVSPNVIITNHWHRVRRTMINLHFIYMWNELGAFWQRLRALVSNDSETVYVEVAVRLSYHLFLDRQHFITELLQLLLCYVYELRIEATSKHLQLCKSENRNGNLSWHIHFKNPRTYFAISPIIKTCNYTTQESQGFYIL